MAKFTRKNIFSARFVNDERTDIEVLLKNNKTKTLDVYLVDTDPNDTEFQNLLKVYSLDDIEKDTAEFIEAITKADEEFKIAMIEQGRLADSEVQPFNANDLLSLLFDFKAEDADKLFELKLAAFDLDIVNNADTDTKELIRKAETPLELLEIIQTCIVN